MKGHISRDTNMTGDTARHSSVLSKLENGIDRGAPGAKTKHSRIVPWHQGRVRNSSKDTCGKCILILLQVFVHSMLVHARYCTGAYFVPTVS